MIVRRFWIGDHGGGPWLSVDLGGAWRDGGGISIGGGTSKQSGGGGASQKSADPDETDETESAEAGF